MPELDRKSARRIFKKIMTPGFDPDSIPEMLGVDIPYVADEPTLMDFRLAPDALERIEKKDKEFKIKMKMVARFVLFIFVLMGAFFGYTYFDQSIGGIIGGVVIALYPIGMVVYSIVEDIKPRLNGERSAIEAYKSAKFNFEYWKRKKMKDYWRGLSGHDFEHALAQVFRKNGFAALVSKSGGDEGIDIVLEKNGEKMIVQCKSHSKPIGPAVAREFYGTLIHHKYSQGILACTNGFTEGVRLFVKDKNIILLDTNGILKLIETAG